jgi:molecular chaperone GrpE
MAQEKEEKKPEGEQSPTQSHDELAECQKLRDEYLAGWQRARADFINYQKQEEERLRVLAQFANQGLIIDLLVVLDSFDLAAAHASSDQERRSFELIQSQLVNVLKKSGLEKIKASAGDALNPEFHEVVAAVPDGSQVPGAICEVVSCGYTLHGKVVRAARVKVKE